MARRAWLGLFLLLAAGCQYVTGLEDLEIVTSSQGAAPQGGEPAGAGPSGGAPGNGGEGVGAGNVGGMGGEGGAPVVTTQIHAYGVSNQPLSMAQNEDAVFFSDSALGASAGRIWRWEKSAGPDAAVEVRSGEHNPRNLWATSTDLFWTTGEGPEALVRLDLDDLASGTPETIAGAGAISDVAVDPAGLRAFVGDGDVRVAGGAMLYASQVTRFDVRDPEAVFAIDAGTLYEVQKSGPPAPTMFMSGGGKGGFLAVASDADAVYAIGFSSLQRKTKAGTSSTLIPNLMAAGRDVAVDDLDQEVYFAVDSGIRRMPKTGGELTTITTGSPWRILIDAGSIYWFDISDGGVWCTPR